MNDQRSLSLLRTSMHIITLKQFDSLLFVAVIIVSSLAIEDGRFKKAAFSKRRLPFLISYPCIEIPTYIFCLIQ